MKGYKIGIEKNSCHSFSSEMNINQGNHCRLVEMRRLHRIKISNRRATQRCNVSSFFYAKICSLLARRQSSQPVQRVYWPENVIDWLGKWRPTCVMRHARGQKLQSFRRKWPFCMDLYSMTFVSYARNGFYRSKCTYTREFDVIPATGASYWPIIAQYTRVQVKPDILKNSK